MVYEGDLQVLSGSQNPGVLQQDIRFENIFWNEEIGWDSAGRALESLKMVRVVELARIPVCAETSFSWLVGQCEVLCPRHVAILRGEASMGWREPESGTAG